MPKQRLIDNIEKYRNRYVLLKSFLDDQVIMMHNENSSELLKQAAESGYDDPVIIYIPNEIDHVYEINGKIKT